MRRALAVSIAVAGVAAAVAPSPALSQERARFDTRLVARVPAPGFPASAYPHPNGRVYVGTYTNPRGDSIPSRVFEYDPDTGSLVRSFVVPGQDLTKDHGIQAATSDASGRLVLLDKAPGRALLLDQASGNFIDYAKFPDLAPCTGAPDGNCSPTTQDQAPYPNYAAWGPGGELYVTDYAQGVVWRVPPGGGDPKVWLADPKLDGAQFGTTGIALEADRSTLVIAQGSSASGADGNPATGKLYKVPIQPDGSPGTLTRFWESPPTALPDGFGIAQSGKIYIALLNAQQIAVVGTNGQTEETFPTGAGGENGSPAPFDDPSSAKFLGTRLMVPNQSFVMGDTSHQTVLDVETREPGLPEFIPDGAGGVDSVAPKLSAVGLRPSRVRRGRNTLLRLTLTEDARLTLRVEKRVGTRWRRIVTNVRPGKQGANAVKVGTRVRRKGVKRGYSTGRYRLIVHATDGSGNRSGDSVRGFRVVR